MGDAVHDARHLTHTNLELLWQGGAPLVLPVHGTPRCDLEFDPPAARITLVTDYQSPEPSLAKLQNITFEPMHIDGRDVAQITISVGQSIHGAYGLLAVIADELQLQKSPLAAAVATGVDQFKDILTIRGALTPEVETGLVGELMFLDYLIHAVGSGSAIEAWLGPMSEEHDFVFDGFDLEIKTTVSERRRHLIGGLGQLVPRPGSSLALVSIQITRAVGGTGLALPGFVAKARALAEGHVVELDKLLATTGWRTADADLYTTRWTLRSTPRAYLVDDGFPAITAAALASAVPNAGLLSDVSYRVDVTDMKYDSLPAPLVGFTETKGI